MFQKCPAPGAARLLARRSPRAEEAPEPAPAWVCRLLHSKMKRKKGIPVNRMTSGPVYVTERMKMDQQTMRSPIRYGCSLLGAVVLFATSGCVMVRTKVDPIEINVNVRIKVERELDDFFGGLDQQDATLQPPSAKEERP